MADEYSHWRAELGSVEPTEHHNVDTEMLGFWRMDGARTKPSWPVAIWKEAGKDATIFQIGRRQPMNSVEHATEFAEFIGNGWLWCRAVPKADWSAALATGFWPGDNKPSRQVTEEQKLDIIPTTPADQGGNMGADEALAYDQQIDAKMKAQLAKHAALGKVDTAEKAKTAAEILEATRALVKLGNARREADRAPHVAAAQAIQNTWLPILTPGSDLVPKIVKEIDDYAKAEKARLQAIEDEKARVERARQQAIKDEEARVERERLQAEEDARVAAENKRIAEENERRQREAPPEAKVELAAPVEAKAIVVEAEQVVVEAAKVETPKVSTTFGRAVSKARIPKGKIIDRAKFIKALAGQDDFETFLIDKANKLARAKTALPGMEITYDD